MQVSVAMILARSSTRCASLRRVWPADKISQPFAASTPIMHPEDSLTIAAGQVARQPSTDADSGLERYGKLSSRVMKRSVDLAGSLCALVLTAPLFLVIAFIIKLTSKGPVLFRQERVGWTGRRFVMLKFRTMHVASASTIHEQYIQRLIAGTVDAHHAGETSVYKLSNDPRVTPVGRLLRRTSLDELPQFFNVLTGAMSLVGPRPPIPYEVGLYSAWHLQRLAVKPGITGLWQVSGRSRLTFDDMVRLDITYARSWSLWLDVKILSRTPWAVASGQGAC